MKKTKISLLAAKKVAGMLESGLKVSANSTSCTFIHQPKAPKSLERYRREQ